MHIQLCIDWVTDDLALPGCFFKSGRAGHGYRQNHTVRLNEKSYWFRPTVKIDRHGFYSRSQKHSKIVKLLFSNFTIFMPALYKGLRATGCNGVMFAGRCVVVIKPVGKAFQSSVKFTLKRPFAYARKSTVNKPLGIVGIQFQFTGQMTPTHIPPFNMKTAFFR